MDRADLLYLTILSLTIIHVPVSRSHPQCLDYRAPFKPSSQLAFCPQNYSEFGCCSLERDRQIENEYNTLLTKIALRGRPKCANLIKEVLCLECHQYAAHIFEAEGNVNFDVAVAAPGLCPSYCGAFYDECEDVVKYLLSSGKWKLRAVSKPTAVSVNVTVPTTSTPTSASSRITRQSFCEGLMLKDADYCYPDVQSVDQKILQRKYNFDSNEGCLCVEEVARGLYNPLAAVHAGDRSRRLFIAEQRGIIRILRSSGELVRQPFLDLRDRVLSSNSYGDERGFLSIAFHPDFRNNRRFFVYYSTKYNRLNNRRNKKEPSINNRHRTVLSQFKASMYNRDRGLKASEVVILQIEQPDENHNGGMIFFGIDGFLYLTIGDGGGAGDRYGKIGNGLNRTTLLGSVIRIDVDDRGYRYRVPPDNPFLKIPGVRPEIYAYGTRNMWRCSLDRGDRKTGEGRGRIFCGDVGQNKYEEIDIIEKGGNYGWRAFEGFQCYDPVLCSSPLVDNAIPPIFAYNHSVGKSIVGGYVYRGCQNPNMRGKYLLGDTMTSRVFLLTENKTTGVWKDQEVCFGDDKYCTNKLTGQFERFILSFGEDEEGELYILSTDVPRSKSKGGKVYRIVDPERRGDPSECRTNGRNPSTTCKDSKNSQALCKFYQRNESCLKYEAYFRKHCKKTCGFC